MFCNHQNTLKTGDCNLGPTISPFLMMTKHMSYLNKNGRRAWKAPPQTMLCIYQEYMKSYVNTHKALKNINTIIFVIKLKIMNKIIYLFLPKLK